MSCHQIGLPPHMGGVDMDTWPSLLKHSFWAISFGTPTCLAQKLCLFEEDKGFEKRKKKKKRRSCCFRTGLVFLCFLSHYFQLSLLSSGCVVCIFDHFFFHFTTVCSESPRLHYNFLMQKTSNHGPCHLLINLIPSTFEYAMGHGIPPPPSD